MDDTKKKQIITQIKLELNKKVELQSMNTEKQIEFIVDTWEHYK